MPGVIDGRRWWRQRIAHLEEALRGDLSDEQRAEIEAELAQARMELRSNRRWLSWLLWGHR
ncbi:MAG TPA: hypothetical protein VGL49_06200 [Acidimicrobiales bacterium]|jgi:hypothetical protein